VSCSNDECRDGWVEVDAAGYAEHQYPVPDDAPPAEVAAIMAKRQQVASTMVVRPCGDCRPEALERWAAGCLRSDHRASTCDLCLAAMGEDGARQHDRGVR